MQRVLPGAGEWPWVGTRRDVGVLRVLAGVRTASSARRISTIRADKAVRAPTGYQFMLSSRNLQATTTRNEPRGQVRAAFTLIELMVVMILIGILTAMIIPEMKGTYEDALLRSTSRELVNACSLAYSRAVSFNQTCRVRLDLSTGRYAVEKHVWDNGQEIYVPLRDVPGGEGKLDTRIAIEVRPPDQSLPSPPGAVAPSDFANASQRGGREVVIGFYPDGTADAQDLVLTDRQGFRLALRINPITSRVNVVDLDRELASASTTRGAR